jgi:hypothetical protein
VYPKTERKVFDVSILCIHAPTEDKDGPSKDAFYDLLTNTLHKIPKPDVKIIMGDFNAKLEIIQYFHLILDNMAFT